MPQFSPQGEPDPLSSDYLGFQIVHKTDLGRNGYWDEARQQFVAAGFIVTREGHEAFPAGIWFETVGAALRAIDVFTKVQEDPRRFLACMHASDGASISWFSGRERVRSC